MVIVLNIGNEKFIEIVTEAYKYRKLHAYFDLKERKWVWTSEAHEKAYLEIFNVTKT